MTRVLALTAGLCALPCGVGRHLEAASVGDTRPASSGLPADLRIRVLGTASFQGRYTALIQDLNTLSDSFYRVDDSVYGYRVLEITDSGIRVEKGDRSYTVAVELSSAPSSPASQAPASASSADGGAPNGYLSASAGGVTPNLYLPGDGASGEVGRDALASAGGPRPNFYLDGPAGTQWDLWTPERKLPAAASEAAARVADMVGGRFIVPVATFKRLSSKFGYRVHPIKGGRRMHKGLDFSAKTGTRILAADSGKVIWSGWKGGYGYCLQIDHQNGYTTTYGHCSKLVADVGDNVRRGEYVAEVGSTGHSTGPHLHFEVRKSGKPIDPAQFFKDKL